MKTVHFYHKETGVFNGVRFSSSDEKTIALNTPPDHVTFEGEVDPTVQRVDVITGKLVSHVYEKDQRTIEREQHVQRRKIQRQIDQLEQRSLRAYREMLLGYDGAKQRLQTIDEQIIVLRGTLNERATKT